MCVAVYNSGRMFIKKTKVRSGKEVHTYLQLVESVWKDGRPTHRVVASLGREDRLSPGQVDRLIASLAPYSLKGAPVAEPVDVVETREYGTLLVLEHLWKSLGLDRLLGSLAEGRSFAFDLEAAVRAMVFARVLEPSSDRGVLRWAKQVWVPGLEQLKLQHLYRSLDFLSEAKEDIEARLLQILTQQLMADVRLVLFDTTSVYLEGDGPKELAQFGYSRDKRPDRRQFILGLLTSQEGLPLAHVLMPGSTSDLAAMQEAISWISSSLPVSEVIVVADRGMVSTDNLKALEGAHIRYIVGTRLRHLSTRKALARAGRYKVVAKNLRVKEAWLDGKRYVVCLNPQEAERDRSERAGIVAHIEKQIASGAKSLLKGAARRYVSFKGQEASLNRKRIAEDAQYDGKWVLLTTTDLPPEKVAESYKGLWRVERAFRTLKTPLELRPVYHWTESRVRGHVMVCVLAYLLERLLEHRLEKAGLALSAAEALGTVSSLKTVKIELASRASWRLTRPADEAKHLLAKLGLELPARLSLEPASGKGKR